MVKTIRGPENEADLGTKYLDMSGDRAGRKKLWSKDPSGGSGDPKKAKVDKAMSVRRFEGVAVLKKASDLIVNINLTTVFLAGAIHPEH